MKTRTLQATANVFTLVFALVFNTLANTLPLNGRTTGQISDSFNSLFTPAGYVFSIWGLIYLSLLGFTIYQALPAQQTNPRVVATGWWVAIGNVANGLWIVFWHYELYPLTVITMLILLVSLIIVYQRINAPTLPKANAATRWLVQFPFSLYLGWISVATVANIATLLLWLGWDGWGVPVIWTVLMIAVAAVLSLLMRDTTYTGVIVWATFGIVSKQAAQPTIVIAGYIAIAICVVVELVRLWRNSTLQKKSGTA